jgi:2-iminoacetate synthase
MPFANITISSRENARFRDQAVAIAATKISAGVDVGIGGHGGVDTTAGTDSQDSGRSETGLGGHGEAQIENAVQGHRGDEQFEIDDGRSVREIKEMLYAQNLQPVMSDYIYV